MKQGPDQIALPLDWPQNDGDARFILSDANRDAFDHFRKWTMWPVKATILTGRSAAQAAGPSRHAIVTSIAAMRWTGAALFPYERDCGR